MPETKLTAVAPILQVIDLQRAIDFYQEVMGFKLGWKSGNPAFIASVCRDAVELHLLVVKKVTPSHVYIFAEHLREYFTASVRGGAKVVYALEPREYGMLDGRLQDPDGNQLSIGEPLTPG